MRPPPASLRALSALLLATLCAACSEVGPVNVKIAPGFTPNRATVSVLGVFRDGRMSSEAWTPIGPPLSTALGEVGDTCDVAYRDRLQQEKPALFTVLEEDTRANGIPEDMLARVAPQAEGELILTIIVHGRIVQQAARDDMPPPSAGAMRPGAAGGGLGRGRGGGAGPGQRSAPSRSTAPGGLELAASLFSVRQHKSVARLNMSYTGTSVEEAFRRFAAEVAAVVPGSTCKGWNWKDTGQASGTSGTSGLGLP